jgi:hypothetical protein
MKPVSVRQVAKVPFPRRPRTSVFVQLTDGRGSHSSILQLNLSAFYVTGGAVRGCFGGVYGVVGGMRGV